MNQVLTALAANMERFSSSINRVCLASASTLMLVMLVTVGIQVIARYVFFSPPSWTEELARYSMIWAGYLGATVAFYQCEDPVLVIRKHTREGAFSTINMLLRNVAVLLFMLPIIYWSPVIIRHHMVRETESMELTSAYVMLIVPLFALIILVHVLARLMAGVKGHGQHMTPDDLTPHDLNQGV